MATPAAKAPETASNGHSTAPVPVKIKRPPAPPTRSLGRAGLAQFDGYIHEERVREFMGRRKSDLIREMLDTDPDVGAMIFAITQLLRRVGKQIVPGAEGDADEETAKFVESCFDDMEMPWPEVLTEVLTMLWWGWAWLEVVYKHRDGQDASDLTQRSLHSDGKVGWRGWYIRAQDTLLHWDFDDEDRVKGWVQTPPPTYEDIYLPAERGLLFRTISQKGNPEGRSILQNAIRPYYYKKQLEQIEAIGAERDLAGLPVAYVPPEIMSPNASEDDKALFQEIKKLVTNIRRDEQEGVVFPLAFADDGHTEAYRLELLNAGGSRQFDTDKIITRYSRQVVQTLLADFIKLGEQAVGSFALSSDKTSLFAVALGAWLDTIAAVINQQAIPELLRYNGIQTETPPKLVFGDIESRDVAQTVDAILKLTQAGMEVFPDPRITKHLLDMLDIPSPSLEELEARAEAQRAQEAAMQDQMLQGAQAEVGHTQAKIDDTKAGTVGKVVGAAVQADANESSKQQAADDLAERRKARQQAGMIATMKPTAKKAIEERALNLALARARPALRFTDLDPIAALLGDQWPALARDLAEDDEDDDPLASLLGEDWWANPALDAGETEDMPEERA